MLRSSLFATRLTSACRPDAVALGLLAFRHSRSRFDQWLSSNGLVRVACDLRRVQAMVPSPVVPRSQRGRHPVWCSVRLPRVTSSPMQSRSSRSSVPCGRWSRFGCRWCRCIAMAFGVVGGSLSGCVPLPTVVFLISYLYPSGLHGNREFSDDRRGQFHVSLTELRVRIKNLADIICRVVLHRSHAK